MVHYFSKQVEEILTHYCVRNIIIFSFSLIISYLIGLANMEAVCSLKVLDKIFLPPFERDDFI